MPILLEELGADYRYHSVNIREGAQKTPAFLALNANGKVPVIVDEDGPGGQSLTLTESAAILVYLAVKYSQFLPQSGEARARTFEWLFIHASALGPAFGQSGYFQKLAPEKNAIAIERFSVEAKRTLKIVDGRLAYNAWLAGNTYTIADMANFGWIWRRDFAGVDFSECPNVERWYRAMEARPAVARAIARLTPQA